MTVDLTVPKRWVEGHLSDLDSREAGADHAVRAAVAATERRRHLEELAEIRAAQQAWREVLRRITEPPTRHRLREPR